MPKALTTFTNAQPSLLGSFLGSDPPSRDWQARLLVARGDLHAAIAEYERLNHPTRESSFVTVFDPLHVLEIARLHDRKGDRDAAVRAYERFLELWKNADPGLSETEEARRYLASASG